MELVQNVTIRVKAEGAQGVDNLAGALEAVRTAAGEASKATGAAAGSMDKATTATGKLTQAAEGLATRGLGPITGQLATMGRFVIPAGIALGLGAMAKSSIDAADNLSKVSKQTGLAVEDLSKLKYAAGLADTSLGEITIGIRAMSRTVDDALAGNKNLRASFAAVGVTLSDLQTKSPVELFLKIATGLQAIPDPATRAAKAQEVLGRSAMTLLPLMQDLAGDGFARVSEEAERAGQVISGDTARAAEEFNDNIVRLKAQLMGAGNEAIKPLVPVLRDLSDVLVRGADGWVSWLNPLKLVSEAIRGIHATVTVFVGQIATMFSALGAFADRIGGDAGFGKTGWGQFKDALGAARDEWKDQQKGVQDRLYGMFFGGAGGPSGKGPGGGGADTNRAVGVDTAAADAAKRSADERARELELLGSIATRHAQLLNQAATITESERETNRLLMERDEELGRITKTRHLSMIEFLNATAGVMATYSSLIAKVQQDAVLDQRTQEHATLFEFTETMARESREAMANIRAESAREFAQNVEETSARGIEMLERMREKATGLIRGFVADMSRSLADAISDAAMTGGKNFGEIAGAAFGQMATQGADAIVAQLGKGMAGMFGDKITETADGKFLVGDKSYNNLNDAVASTRGGKVMAGGMAAIQIGAGAYEMGKAPGGRTAATTGGLMAGAGAGAMYGTAAGPWGVVIGAVVGAIVGAIGGWMGEKAAQDDYKYGIPFVRDGQAGFGMGRNMQNAEIEQAIAATQATFDMVRNGLVKALLEFPAALIPAVEDIDGRFQDAASSKYLKHLQEWLTQTLPRHIIPHAPPPPIAAFTGAGMTLDAAENLMDQAKNMDPKLALQYLTDAAAGLNAWNRALANMDAVRAIMARPADPDFLNPGLFNGQTTFVNGKVQAPGEGEFVGNVRAAGEGLFKIAREFANLTGNDRVAAFRALGQGIEGLTLDLQDFLHEVGEASRNIRQSISDARLEKEIGRAVDDGAKIDILKREWMGIQYKLLNAGSLGLSPADIEALSNRGLGILNQIYETNPSEEMYQWWLTQVQTLDNMSTGALQQIADKAVSAVEAVLQGLEPFRDWFLGLPVDIDPAITEFVSSITGASQALRDLARAAAEAKDPNDHGRTTPKDGGIRRGDPKTPPEAGDGAPVTININAPVYGDVEALRRDITLSVAAAQRRTPDRFAPDF